MPYDPLSLGSGMPFARRFVYSILLLIPTLSVSPSQMFKLTDGTMFYPSRLQVGQIKHSLGLTLARPPDDVVEEFADVVTVPLIEYQFQYGLAENIQVEGRATTIYAANQV